MINRSRFPNFISRSEIKLKLKSEEAEKLLLEVAKHLPVYCYVPAREITFVSSVYFDTEDLLFYNRAKWFPHDNLKIRLKEYYYQVGEGYEFSPDCWIEIKRRLNQSTIKSRFQIPKELVAALFRGENLYERIVAANEKLTPDYIRRIYGEFLRVIEGRELKAHSVTNYRRRTFQEAGDESVRITFDDMIAYFRAPVTIFNGSSALLRELLGDPAGQQKNTVVEIKVARSKPEWLRTLLRRYPRSNFSKFLTSTQTLLTLPGGGLRTESDAESRWRGDDGMEEERKRVSGDRWHPLDRVGRGESLAGDDGKGASSSVDPSPRTP